MVEAQGDAFDLAAVPDGEVAAEGDVAGVEAQAGQDREELIEGGGVGGQVRE
ncbi:hypothetical protein VSR01_15740 [Actinacidiphila sp. DG2A-62]|uniref:hypothetical protein n=1 Tax=Actinacidiphila sp. DG2A-62 TaxID=3108821 RepID=UPI002DBC2CE9|nr:hypothetical protein [Actinacidiphila sp. DG2A-62]MEC3994903.1 hypothetical protein [Actinacidiphila sp. DG2A-62]